MACLSLRHFSKEIFYILIMLFIQVSQSSSIFSEISHNDVRQVGTSLIGDLIKT